MQPAHDDLIDRLAAEYVLGTLRGRARDRFERWLDDDVATRRESARRAVHRWENRLVHLADSLQPVDPSPRVWRELRARIATRRAGPRWQSWAVAASVLLVMVATWLGFEATRSDWQTTAQLRESTSRVVGWEVALDRSQGAIRVEARNPPPLDAGRAHELWALPAGGQPVSLGLLPRQGVVERRLTAPQLAALASSRQLAVSLEPAGGSPTGAPTGPVLIVADRTSS